MLSQFNGKTVWLSMGLLLFVLMSCHRIDKVDVEAIELPQEFKYFQEDLFAIPPDDVWGHVDAMLDKYPEFFPVFNMAVISIGDMTQFDYDRKLARFLSDPDMRMVYAQTQDLFMPFQQKESIHKAFKRYHYYLPEAVVPAVYTHISGFNQSVVVDSTYLSIALDKYLGVQSKYYQMLRTQQYLRQNMHPAKIPTDALWAWLTTEYPDEQDNPSLLDEMVYYGKLHYFMDALFPDTPDSLRWGMPDAKLKWCERNERHMWTYLIENKLLYSTAHKDIVRYVENGPFTSSFSKESPGRTGQWLGYKIVWAYMHKNDVSLADLLAEEDAQKILQASKYRP